ncbi:MAG: electron transfer flavoprotein subunit beta/FixA family protein [Desulfobacterales bacterium]|jgi:electron transfer flavoprotein beta subunit
MKILVCIKQVCESDSLIQIDNNASWIEEDVIADYKMNRLDEFAVEEAVRLKEAHSDIKVDVITVGPDRSAEILKRAIGMGANRGIHVIGESKSHISPFTIASSIADYARDKSYALILAGVMSEDLMQGQIGPMIAACLSLPWATSVIQQRLAPDKNSIYVEREIEGGNRDTLELQLPAVLTIQSGINTPRYPSLSNLLRANKQELEIIRPVEGDWSVVRQRIIRVAYPEKSRSGRFLSGTRQEKATTLLNLLREKSLLQW